ncbi:MAG: CHASE2 domain-containing protein [Leptolyngbyaceae cyanobacterium HOT.MB2.61]|nr:CHASE2 domain-containing protein [Leptolyngbyaceae cyanobacterium HOT.MB2.61]
MQRNMWKSLKEAISNWRVWALPGTVVIGLVVAARLLGSLEGLELLAFDTFLRLRPAEPEDDRIVLIGIDEADLQKTGYPIPEQELISLLNTLQTYKPAVIGLHIYQTQIAQSDDFSLFRALQRQRNLIVTERIIPASDWIPPPAGFPPKQIGFVDVFEDEDKHLRRLTLGMFDPLNRETFKFSMVIRLAEAYLSAQSRSLTLSNGIRDPDAMRFGNTELPRLEPNSGGYVRAEMGDIETLINFRSGHHPFRLLSLNQIKAGKFQPDWLRDRIVIVSITDSKIRPIIFTAAQNKTHSLHLHAHTVSQIISAVLDGRPLLKTWTDSWEYLWIFTWGCLAILLGRSNLLPRTKLICIGIVQVFLIGISYLLLLWGWWIPIVPIALVWLLNGIGYTAFYKYDWVLRSRLKDKQLMVEERQRTIEQTFNVIHNGPLQTLASLLRRTQDSPPPQEQLLSALERLNTEIRGISEHLKQEILTQEESLYLSSGAQIDLKLPIHELFYEVYSHTLERPEFSRFKTLKVACQFEPIQQSLLSVDQKRDLCRFLEEALCNIGKHAEGATHLSITGTHQKGGYTLQVTDDGVGIKSSVEGEGTRYARRLASALNGKFRRDSLSPKGTRCELSFPLTKSRSWSSSL